MYRTYHDVGVIWSVNVVIVLHFSYVMFVSVKS